MKAKVIVPPFDREMVFQFVVNNDWKELINILKNNKKCEEVLADPNLADLIDSHFVNALLNTATNNVDSDYKSYLQDFFILHQSTTHTFQLKIDDFRKLIERIVEVESSLEQAYQYALFFPESESCELVIQQFEKQRPTLVSHSQADKIIITENNNLSSVDARISLFKSRQEYQFYRAVREVFPSFNVFPNVALSAVLDFNLIKDSLSYQERDYFFKALIDCVVIDSENNFMPIRFVELDSPYHDDENQRQKDTYKDNIFSLAGQKLIRIRQITFQEEEPDFMRLIREAIR